MASAGDCGAGRDVAMTAEEPSSRFDELVREIWNYPLLGAMFGRPARRFAGGTS